MLPTRATLRSVPSSYRKSMRTEVSPVPARSGANIGAKSNPQRPPHGSSAIRGDWRGRWVERVDCAALGRWEWTHRGLQAARTGPEFLISLPEVRFDKQPADNNHCHLNSIRKPSQCQHNRQIPALLSRQSAAFNGWTPLVAVSAIPDTGRMTRSITGGKRWRTSCGVQGGLQRGEDPRRAS